MSSNRRRRIAFHCGNRKEFSSRMHVPVLMLLMLVSWNFFSCVQPQHRDHDEDEMKDRKEPTAKTATRFETVGFDERKSREEAEKENSAKDINKHDIEKTSERASEIYGVANSWNTDEKQITNGVTKYIISPINVTERPTLKDINVKATENLSLPLSAKADAQQARSPNETQGKRTDEQGQVIPISSATNPSFASSKCYHNNTKETLSNQFMSTGNSEMSAAVSESNATECSKCDWNQTNNETRQLCEGEGQIEWEEPSVSCSCIQQISWHIKPNVPDYGIIAHFTHFNFKWYERLEVYAGDRRTAENLLMQFPSLTNAVQLLPQPEILVWVRTLPWPFFTIENFPSSFGLNYSTHPMRYMPVKVSLDPPRNHLESLSAVNESLSAVNDMYNCSAPYTVPQYILCDMVEQCIGGEDEPVNCSYKSANCSKGWFPYNKRRCLKISITYQARSNRCKEEYFSSSCGEKNKKDIEESIKSCGSEQDAELASLPEPAARKFVGNIVGRLGIRKIILNVALSRERDIFTKQNIQYRFAWKWGSGHINHGDRSLQESGAPWNDYHGYLLVFNGDVSTLAVPDDIGDDTRTLQRCLFMKHLSSPEENVSLSASNVISASDSVKMCPDKSFVQIFHSCRSSGGSADQPSNQMRLFSCIKNGEQVHFSFVCDGTKHCSNGSDENMCTETNQKLSKDFFVCDSKQPVLKGKQCDGVWDCVDGSDEKSCYYNECNRNTSHFYPYGCLPNNYSSIFQVQSNDELMGIYQLNGINLPPVNDELVRSNLPDGINLPPVNVTCDNRELDLVVATTVFENSLEVTIDSLGQMLSSLRSSIGRIQIGFVTLEADLNVEFMLNSMPGSCDNISVPPKDESRPCIQSLLEKMEKCMFSRENGDRPDVPNLILLIVQIDFQQCNEQEFVQKRIVDVWDGTRFLVVFVGQQPDMKNWKNLVSQPLEEHLFLAKSFNDIQELFYKIAVALCSSDSLWVQKERRNDASQRDVDKYMYPPAVLHLDGYGMSTLEKLKEQSCPQTHYQCQEGFCIPTYLLHNGVADCPLKDDEYVKISACDGYYHCHRSRICLHLDYLCDTITHCPESDDELFCAQCPKNCTCEGLALKCNGDFPLDGYWLQMRYLDLSETPVDTHSPMFQNLQRAQYLMFLNLSFCSLTKINLNGFPLLRILDLSYNNFSEFSSLSSGLWLNLLVLNLSNNPIRFDTSFTDFVIRTSLANLRTLIVSNTRVENISKQSLDRLKNLQELDIRNKLVYLESKVFGPNLQVLYVSNLKFCCPYYHHSTKAPDICPSFTNELLTCGELLQSNYIRFLLWTLCFMALFGNLAVIVFRTCMEKYDSSLTYKVLIVNLSTSDFLMGVYMAMVGGADAYFKDKYISNEKEWRTTNVCKAAGFLAMLSSEVSAFVICLITLDRLLLLLFPFRTRLHLSKFSAQLSCAVAWFLGVILTAFPLFRSEWDFYNQTSICLPLPITQRHFPGQWYAFGIFIVLNFTLFLFIGVGQILIYLAIQRTANATQKDSRKREVVIIARRLFLIVFTDFCCWFPVGLMGLLVLRGQRFPDTVNLWAAVFVLPLNSAINPFLYTLNVLLERRAEVKEQKQVVKMMNNLQDEMHTWPRDLLVEHVRFCLRAGLVDREDILALQDQARCFTDAGHSWDSEKTCHHEEHDTITNSATDF